MENKSKIIYGKRLSESLNLYVTHWTYAMNNGYSSGWTFYRECLTGLSNPESCVSYRGPCCACDLGSSSGARRKSRERRSSGCDEKRRRNLKRWKITLPPAAPRIRELALLERTWLRKRSAKYPVVPHRNHVSSFASTLENVSLAVPVFIANSCGCWYLALKMIRENRGEKPRYRLLWNFWNDNEFVLNLIYRNFSSNLTSLDVYILDESNLFLRS